MSSKFLHEVRLFILLGKVFLIKFSPRPSKLPQTLGNYIPSACLVVSSPHPPVYLLPSLVSNSTSVSLSLHSTPVSDPKKLCFSRAAILKMLPPALGTALRERQILLHLAIRWGDHPGICIPSTVAGTYWALHLH